MFCHDLKDHFMELRTIIRTIKVTLNVIKWVPNLGDFINNNKKTPKRISHEKQQHFAICLQARITLQTLQTQALSCKIVQFPIEHYICCRVQTCFHLMIYCSFEEILWGWTGQLHLECAPLPCHGAMFFSEVQYTKHKIWTSCWIWKVSVRLQNFHYVSLLGGVL